MKTEKINYNDYINIIGTAHFTRRSIKEAYEVVKTFQPIDLALELDLKRFKRLNTACLACPRRGSCRGLCEFTVAAETLGNVNANIWLIDMTEEEMRDRIRRNTTHFERLHMPMYRSQLENPTTLWERGFKLEAIKRSKGSIERLRRVRPNVWQVLIDERDTLMAARLRWIVLKRLREQKNNKVLALVGAAHADGIRKLLKNPYEIEEELKRLGLLFTKPILIRRVAVGGD
ncbi:hypothetical protein GTO27_09050 [Candidatus Bathyarchaeota archaeon]|nr:hypothetical protein [Candidatus Bathyarchaeota archaeon]